jgi:hypothetical protein
MLLKRQLQQMRFNPNLETMSKYLLRMDKLTRQLWEAGVTIDEEDYICNILLSLPPEYNMVATAIEKVPASEVDVPFVRNRLLEEESKRLNMKGSKGKPEGSTEMVFGTKQPGNSGANSNYTSKQSEPYQGNRGKFLYPCHNCNKYGHKHSECRLKPSYYNGQQQRWNKIERNYTRNQNQHWKPRDNRRGMKKLEWCSLKKWKKVNHQVMYFIHGASEHYVKESVPICNKKY